MTDNFFATASAGSSSFIKPADYTNAFGLLVEPIRLDEDCPNSYNGVESLRDELVADVTVFESNQSLERGEPTEILPKVRITPKLLTLQLGDNIGGVMFGGWAKSQTKNGFQAFRWTDNREADALKLAQQYVQGRDTAVEDAVADAPSFD